MPPSERRDAFAAVPDAEDGVAVLALHRDVDAAAGRRVLDRVREEVRDDLFQPDRVGLDHRLPGAGADRQGQVPRLGAAADQRHAVPGHVVQIDERPVQHDLPRRDARDVEEVVDELAEVARLAGDDRALVRGLALLLQRADRQRHRG
jgi:hypothetical protein